MKTIKDVEEQFQTEICAALKKLDLLPEGYQYSVRLHGESRKKKQTALLEKNWHPDTDSVNITFERTPESAHVESRKAEAAPPAAVAIATAPSLPLDDLVRALDRAESRPGYKFVALKWFRDTALPSEGLSWASNDTARRAVLAEAIDNKLVLTNSVPNPNSPYPTTAVRLNRLMPQVRTILGIESRNVPDFVPVPIRGENLSATVARDRR
jgi:hypothetical protein